MAHWACTSCHSLNDDRSKRCYKCREKRTGDAPVPVETVRPVYDEWASSKLARPGAPVAREPSLLGALLLGTVAACFATAGWVLVEGGEVRRGLVYAALIVGFIVAWATVIGARGRTSFLIVLISGLLTIASVAAGEYLIVSAMISPPGTTGFVVQPPDEVLPALLDAVKGAPLRPVLWLFAIGEGFAIPWTRLVGPVEGTKG